MTWEGLSPPYPTIVADPPWPLAKARRGVRPNQRGMPYSTMGLEEIEALPVAELAADVSMLFLWTIDRFLYQTPRILKAWGFKYHLTLSWDKTAGMAMFGFQRQTEFVLVGLRGRHYTFPPGPLIRSSFTARAHGHSTKPDLFFDMVESRCPGPYVELFARAPRLGWDSYGWGYELEGRGA